MLEAASTIWWRTLERRSHAWLVGLYVLSLAVFLASVPAPRVDGHLVGSDGVYYYAYLPALLIDGSLDLSRAYAGLLPAETVAQVGRSSTGLLRNDYAFGPALLWAPFFLVGHGLVLLLRTLGSTVPADGIGTPYQVATLIGSITYGFIALLLIHRSCRRFFDRTTSTLVVVLLWATTNVLYYIVAEPSMSHTVSLFAVALFVELWLASRRGPGLRQWALIGLAGGLVAMVRLPDVTFLALPVLDAAVGGRLFAPSFREGQARHGGHREGTEETRISRGDAENAEGTEEARISRADAENAEGTKEARVSRADVEKAEGTGRGDDGGRTGASPNSSGCRKRHLPASEARGTVGNPSLFFPLRSLRLGISNRTVARGLVPRPCPCGAQAPALQSRKVFTGALSWFCAEGGGRRTLICGVVFAGGFVVAFAPQMAVWQLLYGSPFVSGYLYTAGPTFFWLAPRALEVLFSPLHGLFLWHPLLLLATVGLGLLYRRDRRLTLLIALGLAMQVYVIGAWRDWGQGDAFGGRMFISSFPVLALGLGALIEWAARRGYLSALATTGVLLMVWNGLLLMQYRLGYIPMNAPISLEQFTIGKVSMLVDLTRKLISRTGP